MFMSNCCKTALTYGDMPLSVEKKPKKVTVILNPAANKRYLIIHFVQIKLFYIYIFFFYLYLLCFTKERQIRF